MGFLFDVTIGDKPKEGSTIATVIITIGLQPFCVYDVFGTVGISEGSRILLESTWRFAVFWSQFGALMSDALRIPISVDSRKVAGAYRYDNAVKK